MTPTPLDLERIKADMADKTRWSVSDEDTINRRARRAFLEDLPACVEEIERLRSALDEIADLTGGTGTVGIIALKALGR